MALAVPLNSISYGVFSTLNRFSCLSFCPISSFRRTLLTVLPQRPLLFGSKKLPRATEEGLPTELVEDSKFVPLNADDPRYGPPALLLVGFEAEEVTKIQQLLREMDGDFLKVIICTKAMLRQSLWEAMSAPQPNLQTVDIAASLPRICFLSGLSGEEMMMLIDAFPDTGLQPAIFAALVPNSANKPLTEVMEEIVGDHEMLSSRQSDPS